MLNAERIHKKHKKTKHNFRESPVMHVVRTALTQNPVDGGFILNAVKGRLYVPEKRKRLDVFYLGQNLLVLDDVFIGGQQHVELPAAQLWHKPPAEARSALEAEQR